MSQILIIVNITPALRIAASDNRVPLKRVMLRGNALEKSIVYYSQADSEA